tara:strand:- start:3285 stop:3671 length:387 start_codon:yes stop_codon:yes gene_type:complete
MKLQSKLISIAYDDPNLIGLSEDGSLHIIDIKAQKSRCVMPPHDKVQREAKPKKSAWQIEQDIKRTKKMLAEIREDKDNYHMVKPEPWKIAEKKLKPDALASVQALKSSLTRANRALKQAAIAESKDI